MGFEFIDRPLKANLRKGFIYITFKNWVDKKMDIMRFRLCCSEEFQIQKFPQTSFTDFLVYILATFNPLFIIIVHMNLVSRISLFLHQMRSNLRALWPTSSTASAGSPRARLSCSNAMTKSVSADWPLGWTSGWYRRARITEWRSC